MKQILLELPEDARICGKCSGNFKLTGKKLVRRELQIIPRQCRIIEYYSCTYACDRCEKDTCFAYIVATQTPPAQMKRKWREAMPDSPTVKTSKAVVGFQYCSKLFAHEKKCSHLNDKLRKEYRQNIILPVLEEYFCWVNTLNSEKGSKLETAVTYTRNQKYAFCAFWDYGDVPISNNLAENAIRSFAVGRKN